MKPLFPAPPQIDITLADIAHVSRQFIGKLSISGVQKKLSLRFDPSTQQLIPAAIDGEYILKPQLDQWPCVPENENLTMNLAQLVGISVAEHALISLADQSPAYIVKRFDRDKGNKIAFEDFAQLLGLKSDEKYNVSVERMASAIDSFSAAPGLDKLALFKLVLFNFIIGNTDAHTKNYGLLRQDHGYRLCPAYDLVNTRLIIPEDKDETALTIHGKKNHLKKVDFEALADHFKLSSKSKVNVFGALNTLQTSAASEIQASLLPAEMKTQYAKIVSENLGRISPSSTPSRFYRYVVRYI